MSTAVRINKATLVHHLGEPHGGVANPMGPAELSKWSHRDLLTEHNRLAMYGPCHFSEA